MLGRSSSAVVNGQRLLLRWSASSVTTPARRACSDTTLDSQLETIPLKLEKAVKLNITPSSSENKSAGHTIQVPRAQEFGDLSIPARQHKGSGGPNRSNSQAGNQARRPNSGNSPRTPRPKQPRDSKPGTSQHNSVADVSAALAALAPSNANAPRRQIGSAQQQRWSNEQQEHSRLPRQEGQRFRDGQNQRRPSGAAGVGQQRSNGNRKQKDVNMSREQRPYRQRKLKEEEDDVADELASKPGEVVNALKSMVSTALDQVFGTSRDTPVEASSAPAAVRPEAVAQHSHEQAKVTAHSPETAIPPPISPEVTAPAARTAVSVPASSTSTIIARRKLFLERNAGEYSRYASPTFGRPTQDQWGQSTLQVLGPTRHAQMYLHRHPDAGLKQRKNAVNIVKTLIRKAPPSSQSP